MVKMTSHMTDGNPPDYTTAKEGLKSMKQLTPDNEDAARRYWKTRRFIDETNALQEARVYIKGATKETPDEGRTFEVEDKNAMRAAICSHLHSKSSVPRPPAKSVKVTTLKNSTPPYIKRFQHRLSMLLRLLLNPLSYFHPVGIKSITATGSGRGSSHSSSTRSSSHTQTAVQKFAH